MEKISVIQEREPLKDVGKQYYQYAGSDNYFVRAGMVVPEALFSYSDFDNTPASKAWSGRGQHYALNPSPELLWGTVKDKWENMMGAANFIIQQGGNTLYCVSMNINGDGADSRFPWVSITAGESLDLSNLQKGIYQIKVSKDSSCKLIVY